MISILLNRFLFRIRNKTCILGRGATINRVTKVGRNCIIGANSILSKNTILKHGVSVGSYVSLSNILVNENSMLESGVKIVGTGKGFIHIGKESYLGINNILDSSNSITIGDYVHIAGPSTGIWTHTTAPMCQNSIPLNDKNRDKYRPTAPIIIESNVYIGGNCTIYPGVTIGHHAIIAPNSAVTKNVEPFTMVGGVPARIIKDTHEFVKK